MKRNRPANTPPARPWVLIGLLAILFLVVIAIFADFRKHGLLQRRKVPTISEDVQRALVSRTGLLASDPKERFSVAVPKGWIVEKGDDAKPYQLLIRSMQGPNIGMMATPVAYDSLAELFKDITKAEVKEGIATELETTRFHGLPAARRTAKLMRVRVLAFDFVDQHVAYHIMCTAPTELLNNTSRPSKRSSTRSK